MHYPAGWKSQNDRNSVQAIQITDANVLKPWLQNGVYLSASNFLPQQQPTLDFIRRSFNSDSALQNGISIGDYYIPSFKLSGSGMTVLSGTPAIYWDFTTDLLGRPVKYRWTEGVVDGKRVLALFRTSEDAFTGMQSTIQALQDAMTFSAKNSATSSKSLPKQTRFSSSSISSSSHKTLSSSSTRKTPLAKSSSSSRSTRFRR